MQFLGLISGRWCDIITMNSLELSSSLYNYVGQFMSLGTLPVHHHHLWKCVYVCVLGGEKYLHN